MKMLFTIWALWTFVFPFAVAAVCFTVWGVGYLVLQGTKKIRNLL